MKMWGGRFNDKLDPVAWAFNASIGFDQRLGKQDVEGSLAWAKALEKAGVLSADECTEIQAGLKQVAEEYAQGDLTLKDSDEDIHTAVERRLGEIIGPLAGKLHTGRSRNDQVASDLRLWLLEHLVALDESMGGLQAVLVARAEADMEVLLPGYTHMQRAQPILLGHWWLASFWPLQRDRDRLKELSARVAVMPLGSGALAGTAFPIDRVALAEDLGFAAPSPNSLEAVSDRDFVAEFLFCAAMTGIHLSQLAERIILFTSAEFGFFELSDAYATGSSLMPQKKNPDVMELTRGKAGGILGALTGLMATLKGLPSTYDKDLQEDKVPLFYAYDTLMTALPVMTGAIRTLTIHPERMQASIDPSMMATDLADYLVLKGMAFREAHELAGRLVHLAAEQGKSLDVLELDDYQSLSPVFEADVLDVFNPEESISRRNVLGGTGLEAVQAQLQQTKKLLEDPQHV